MQRQSLLAGRSNGHPFRKRIPQVRAAVRKREEESDVKLFAVSFAAFFVCFYTFLL